MELRNGEQLIAWLAHAAQVDFVQWDRLGAATRDIEPLTQRERCELLLRAVNGDRLPTALWTRLLGSPSGPRGVDIPMFEGFRPILRADLSRIVENPTTAIAEVGPATADAVDGAILVLQRPRVAGRTWVQAEHLIARTQAHALIYSLNLFLDPGKPFGKWLRQCRWSECGRFALIDPPKGRGQPPIYYCNTIHRDEGEREQTRERVAKLRRKHK